MRYRILNILVLFFALFLFSPGNSIAQETAKEEKEIDIPSSIREELHRYMGYEELLPKYVSLPYDVTMNTNVRGVFLDMGFLFLLFLPILLLFGLKSNWLKIGVGILMMLFLTMSSSTSYSYFHAIPSERITQDLSVRLGTVSLSESPLIYLKLKATQLNHRMYQALDRNVIQVVSGQGDSTTYPIFFLLFIATFLILTKRLKSRPRGEQAIVYLGLLYCFLWLILGAGVPWYGILMIALSLIYLGVGYLSESSKVGQLKYGKYIFIGAAGLWLIMSFNFRMANYQPDSERGRAGAIHIVPLFYGLGKKDKNEALDELFAGYRPIVEEINNNPDALVYRAGTYFQYFIDRNHERVTYDNQLDFFTTLSDNIPNKVTLAKALKNAGYRYFLVDINLAGIDATPEKSLVQKAARLNEFLGNNPAIEPIGTDRVIQLPNGQFVYGFSGGEVKNIGSFIAFKIR